MQATLKLIVSLLVVMACVLTLSSFWQVSQERDRLKAETESSAELLAAGLRQAAEPILSEKKFKDLEPLVADFSGRNNLAGVAVYDPKGALIASSPGLREPLARTPDILRGLAAQTVQWNESYGRFLRIGGEEMHIYATPAHANRDAVYAIMLVHRTLYIRERVSVIWFRNAIRFLVLGVLISLTVLGVFYTSVMAPIRRTADWIKDVRLGHPVAPGRLKPEEVRLLGPVANEVSKLAVSLAKAREAAEEEARLRQSSDSLWTPDRLKEFVRVKMDGRPLFVVSNREPYQHARKGKEIEVVVPASGLVTAIEPVLKACGGTWIAEGNGDADREAVDGNDRLRVPPEEPQYTLRRVWLTKEEEEGYYYGFSNEGLWPLCHVAHTRPTFRESDWLAYEAVNRKFAEAVLKELEGTIEPCVLIQDYHFALLPRLIKSRRPDARVTIFWHIPWPNPESFGICPWQKELLTGMLGSDIIGFHTQYHCNNFLQTVDRILESRIDYEHFTVTREGQTTWVKPFPISIAFLGAADGAGARAAMPDRETLLRPYGLSAEFLGVGVDRMDYTKGIVERFHSVELFLERNPEYVGRFTFVELGAPSRTLIPKYQEFVAEVERETERINARFRAKNWKAILLLKKHHSQKDIAPFYRRADLCMVTSLHDGMNLVAKEFVTARDDERGVLILSQFTGAARELKDSLIINPYDIGQAADAIRAALAMPESEQAERMRRMRNLLKDRNIYRWAADIIQELATVRIDVSSAPARVAEGVGP
ncbi:MAG TPA: trehalose-6-phosphate synthase [Candidatus Eisenbacteria bacterium]|nr:trehalose-6-phosphate synthase [Candidatus Eisenbacteria bacterium]